MAAAAGPRVRGVQPTKVIMGVLHLQLQAPFQRLHLSAVLGDRVAAAAAAVPPLLQPDGRRGVPLAPVRATTMAAVVVAVTQAAAAAQAARAIQLSSTAAVAAVEQATSTRLSP